MSPLLSNGTDATAASVYNNLILSYVVLCLDKEQLFGLLADGATLGDLASARHLEPRRLEVVLRIAVAQGALALEEGRYKLTLLGHDLVKNRGFFSWAIGGYSPLLESIDVFLEAPASSWRPYVRGDYVAIGSDEAHQELMRPVFERAIDALPGRRVADLGCGNAGRLVELLQRRPELTGVGIDIDAGAIDVATANRDRHQLGHRLQLVQENVFTSLAQGRPELADVDVVMSFMMLHDLFTNRDLEGQLFTRMKAAFPQAKYFVMADTCLDESAWGPDLPVFTAGYELVHALRGISVFPLRHYEEQFAAGGLRLVDRYDLGVPNTYLFILEV